jgi:3'-phosphoadenosine 5'-phosphosulfate sulfotransferase (PAPS reductase)/FAD synthetase
VFTNVNCENGYQQQSDIEFSTGEYVVKIKCVVPISGGKDSQASLKLALTRYAPSEIRGLFCDTQFEHPLTYSHVKRISEMYGVRIETVTAGSVEDQCFKHGRFPGGGARFCTEELKIWPTKRYCKALAEYQGEGFEVWYGMRSDESPERRTRYAGKVCDELYAPHEVLRKYPKYLAKLGVMFRLCILDWSDADVYEFVGIDNLNPLYRAGFDRVGCFPCQAAGDVHKERAYAFDDFGRKQRARIFEISVQLGKPMFSSKGGMARNPDTAIESGAGCAFCAY